MLTDLEKAEQLVKLWRNMPGNEPEDWDVHDLIGILRVLKVWADSTGLVMKWEVW